MDVCVVTYRNDASRIEKCLRRDDVLLVRDNTHDNIGFGAGCNRAAVRGHRELICFVNPDGDPQPGMFDELERVLVENPDVVAVEASAGPQWDRGLEPPDISGACFAVRRSAFEAVGGFEERFFLYGEDVELGYRLRELGGLRRAPDAVFAHDDHDRRKRWRPLHLYCRNILLVEKWRGPNKAIDPARMIRDGIWAFRQRHFRLGVAKFTGTASYLLWMRKLPERPRQYVEPL